MVQPSLAASQLALLLKGHRYSIPSLLQELYVEKAIPPLPPIRWIYCTVCALKAAQPAELSLFPRLYHHFASPELGLRHSTVVGLYAWDDFHHFEAGKRSQCIDRKERPSPFLFFSILR